MTAFQFKNLFIFWVIRHKFDVPAHQQKIWYALETILMFGCPFISKIHGHRFYFNIQKLEFKENFRKKCTLVQSCLTENSEEQNMTALELPYTALEPQFGHPCSSTLNSSYDWKTPNMIRGGKSDRATRLSGRILPKFLTFYLPFCLTFLRLPPLNMIKVKTPNEAISNYLNSFLNIFFFTLNYSHKLVTPFSFWKLSIYSIVTSQIIFDKFLSFFWIIYFLILIDPLKLSKTNKVLWPVN